MIFQQPEFFITPHNTNSFPRLSSQIVLFQISFTILRYNQCYFCIVLENCMFTLSTIRGKLIALMSLTFLLFVTLGYLSYSNNETAKKTAEKMILLGEIQSYTNGAMMELRGYQLLYSDTFLGEYTKNNEKLSASIAKLVSMSESEGTKNKLSQLDKHHKEWMKLNEPRIRIISENENEIHSLDFRGTPDGKVLGDVTKNSAATYKKIITEELELLASIKQRSVDKLNFNATIMEIIIAVSLVVLIGIFYLIVVNISKSIIRLERIIKLIVNDRDFTGNVLVQGSDELSWK